jgi:hypothetical protein
MVASRASRRCRPPRGERARAPSGLPSSCPPCQFPRDELGAVVADVSTQHTEYQAARISRPWGRERTETAELAGE